MTDLQIMLVLVASVWAALNTLIAGYTAVNGTRDRVLTGRTDEGVPMSLKHRKLMLRNDWIPMKAALALVCLGFGLFLLFLPRLAAEAGELRILCRAASALPFFGFLTFFFLGIGDYRLMRHTLEAERNE